MPDLIQETLKKMRGSPAAYDSQGLQQPMLDPIQLIASLLGPAVLSMARSVPEILGNEVGAILPEDLAKINATDFYHGSKTPGLTGQAINPHMTSHENLFGQGMYMTDNPEIAQSYARSRGGGATEALYKAHLNMQKGINLEDAVEPDMKDSIIGQAEKIDKRLGYKVRSDHALGDDSESFAQNLKDKIENGTIKTNQDLFHHFRAGIKDISVNEQIPTSEWAEDFQELTDTFKSKGYQGFTHTGGLRTGKGKALHKVMVMLDPKAISEFSQVKP